MEFLESPLWKGFFPRQRTRVDGRAGTSLQWREQGHRVPGSPSRYGRKEGSMVVGRRSTGGERAAPLAMVTVESCGGGETPLWPPPPSPVDWQTGAGVRGGQVSELSTQLLPTIGANTQCCTPRTLPHCIIYLRLNPAVINQSGCPMDLCGLWRTNMSGTGARPTITRGLGTSIPWLEQGGQVFHSPSSMAV